MKALRPKAASEKRSGHRALGGAGLEKLEAACEENPETYPLSTTNADA